MLASTSGDKTLAVWHTSNWGLVRRINDDFSEMSPSMSWSPDSAQIAVGTYDSGLEIWQVASGEKNQKLTGLVAAWMPAGSSVAGGSTSGYITISDPEKGTKIVILKGHGDRVTGLAWGPEPGFLISSSQDGTIKFWDLRDWFAP